MHTITSRNGYCQVEYYDLLIPGTGGSFYAALMERSWRERFKARYQYLKDTEGLTQEKLAEKVGVIQPTIAHWLSGHRTPEDDDQFDRLASAIGMHPAELRYGVLVMSEDAMKREEEWRRLSPTNRAAMRAAIRALADSTDGDAESGGAP